MYIYIIRIASQVFALTQGQNFTHKKKNINITHTNILVNVAIIIITIIIIIAIIVLFLLVLKKLVNLLQISL